PFENVIAQSPVSRDPDAPIVIFRLAVPFRMRFTVPFHVPRNGVATDDGLSVSKPDDEDCELQPTAAARARGMSQRIFGPPVPANWSSALKNGARRCGDA